MAGQTYEIERLKKHVEDIIENHVTDKVHEFRKSLTIAQGKIAEQKARLDKFEKEAELYKKCHDCHRVNVEKRDASTQTATIKSATAETTTTTGTARGTASNENVEQMDVSIPVFHETQNRPDEKKQNQAVVAWKQNQANKMLEPSTSSTLSTTATSTSHVASPIVKKEPSSLVTKMSQTIHT